MGRVFSWTRIRVESSRPGLGPRPSPESVSSRTRTRSRQRGRASGLGRGRLDAVRRPRAPPPGSCSAEAWPAVPLRTAPCSSGVARVRPAVPAGSRGRRRLVEHAEAWSMLVRSQRCRFRHPNADARRRSCPRIADCCTSGYRERPRARHDGGAGRAPGMTRTSRAWKCGRASRLGRVPTRIAIHRPGSDSLMFRRRSPRPIRVRRDDPARVARSSLARGHRFVYHRLRSAPLRPARGCLD